MQQPSDLRHASETLDAAGGPQGRPLVTVIIANYNGGAGLLDAIKSVQKQTLRNIEIIVSDDASTDRSVELTTRLMTGDDRIRLLRSDRNSGPAAARNRAFDVAKGEWIAIVDSDDFIHPARLATLVKYGIRDGADIVADDLLIFDSDHALAPATLLKGRWAKSPFWVDAESYVRRNHLYGRGPILGYLKPMFRSAIIGANSVRYVESLRIGEDYNLVLTLLRSKARFRVYPTPLYFYRRHSSSISHRIHPGDLDALRTADLQLIDNLSHAEDHLRVAANGRIRSIDRALKYAEVLGFLKARHWIKAAQTVLHNPTIAPLLRLPIYARLQRFRPRHRSNPSSSTTRQVCVLSRQRVVGRTNGSSVYLLDLMKAIVDRGTDVHLLSPSPTTLGRWPYIKLSNDLSIFKSVRIRGTWRLGRYYISTDPRRFLRGALAVCDMLALRLGLIKQSFSKKDPYSIAQPLTRRDQLFIARHAPGISDFLIADYCFLTEALPYALRPDSGTAVVMHDRFSSRPEQFANLNKDGVEAVLTAEEECALLGAADTILTIQWDEAAFVRDRLPAHQIIVAPLAAHPCDAPQPGNDDYILFVGSGAAANVDGLRWFIDHCWSTIQQLHPTVKLYVAGTVSNFMGNMPAGVFALGLVNDLDPLYQQAGVVISPLRIGSGLKIKLIEALSRGKSVVGTSTTLQGVERCLADCIVAVDDPERFAAAVVALLRDQGARTALASRALAQVREHFSPEKCYGPFLRAVARSSSSEFIAAQ
jgi:glycosyltransferase involved in cell wall biosynthesis